MSNKLKFTILGSGTSSGVPTIGCNCSTCQSTDKWDKRLRTSLFIQSETTNLVIDTSPDFRQQMLQFNINRLDGILYTHAHFDHIGGFDDLRSFNYITRKPVEVFINTESLKILKKTFSYAFEKPEQLGGGVPVININIIEEDEFLIGDITIIPITLYHGKLKVFGFRISNFAYCTDTNYIPEESIEKLNNLDILVLDALRYKQHPTHFNLDEAIETVKILKPGKAYLTHISHQIKHKECNINLPENVLLAYDGLEIEL